MKQHLNSRNVNFRAISVTDSDNLKKVYKITGQKSVPVTIIGGNAIIGFDTKSVDTALKSEQFI